MTTRRKRHPFGRSWRSEMGQQAKPLTPEQFAAWKAQWLIDEAARKAGYAAARQAWLEKQAEAERQPA